MMTVDNTGRYYTQNGASCTICADGAEIIKAFENVKPGEYDAVLEKTIREILNGK